MRHLAINIAVIFIIAFSVIMFNRYDTLVGQIPFTIDFVAPFGSLVALGLGIGGLMQKDRKKIYAILGTIFSVGTIIVFNCIGLLLNHSISAMAYNDFPNSLITRSAASLPVMIDTGSPAGLYVHCPA